MFPDIGGMEMIIVAIVALVVVKPKDLPVMMRKFGEIMAKARNMANDFRTSFEDMARQSELDDLRKEVEAMRAKATDPMGLKSALSDTSSEINATFEPTSDPNFDYGFSGQDEPVPSTHAPDTVPATAPAKAKRAKAVKAAPAETPVKAAAPKARKTPAKPAATASKTAAAKAPKKRAT